MNDLKSTEVERNLYPSFRLDRSGCSVKVDLYRSIRLSICLSSCCLNGQMRARFNLERLELGDLVSVPSFLQMVCRSSSHLLKLSTKCVWSSGITIPGVVVE